MAKLEELKGKKRKDVSRLFEKLKEYIKEYRDICETAEAIKHDNLPLRLNNIIINNAYLQGARMAFSLIDEMKDNKLEDKYIRAVLKHGIKSLENTERIMRDEPMMFSAVKDEKGKIVGCEAHFTKQVIITDD